MLNAMSVFSRTVDERVGWNRIGAVISIVVIAASLVVLYRLLHDIELAKVTVALAAMPLSSILTAAVFVAASYVTLTFYDFFSLRTIGRDHVPWMEAEIGRTGVEALRALKARLDPNGVMNPGKLLP